MPTKAELSQELDRLRQISADRDKASPAMPANDPAAGPAADPAPDAAPAIDWAGLLGGKGLDGTDTAELLEKLTSELGDLPQNKPLLTAAAAFGLGFVLGRMSK